MSDTAMKAAFRRAGYASDQERLDSFVRSVIIKFRGQTAAVLQNEIYKTACTDDAMMRALFDPWWADATERAICRVRETMQDSRVALAPEQKKPVNGHGEAQRATERQTYSGSPKPAGGLALSVGTQRACAPSVPAPKPKQRVVIKIDEAAEAKRRARSQVETLLKASKLYTTMINGIPLAEVKASDALAWVDSQRDKAKDRLKEIRFVELMATNLPPHKPVGEYRRDLTEIEKLWKRAQEPA